MTIVTLRRPLAPFALAITATLTTLLVGAPAFAQRIANPDLYEKSAEAARQALEHYQAPDDPEALRRVADIGYQVAMQSGYEDVPFTFFLIDMPVPNAFALPGGHIFVTTGMLDLGLTDDMLANLLGHEVAHIMSEHALYRTLLFLLLDFARPIVPVVGQAAMPITLALLEWHRKSEISCDRAGLLTVQDPDVAYGSLGMMAGGIRGREGDVSLTALKEQSTEYLDAQGFDMFFKFMSSAGRTHPFPVIRVAELTNFIEDGPYNAILDGDYVKRGEEPPLVEDLDEARKGFSESAQKVFTNADESVNKTLFGWARKAASGED